MQQRPPINNIETLGDVRQLLIETALNIRNGSTSANDGLAIATLIKTMNDTIQSEINAAKLSLATNGTMHEFGKVVRMGKCLINDNAHMD